MKPDGPLFDASWRAACTIERVTRADAEASDCVRRHYLGKWPGVCVLVLAMRRAGCTIGVIVFALPPRETNKRYGGTTWELARLFLNDSVPKNAETYLIGRAIRYIKRQHPDIAVLVSYADPSAGHSGTIYRASNWTADGRTDDDRKSPRVDYACANTGKKYSRRSQVPEGTRLVRVPRISKHRFVYRLTA